MAKMEEREKGLERTKLMEPWKMLKNNNIKNEIHQSFKIGELEISEIKRSISIAFDKF